MRRNSYLGTSGQKSDPAVRSDDIDFLSDIFISTTELRLLDIFDVFVLLRRMTILTLTFDLLTLKVFHVQRFSCPTHVPIFIILRLLLTELRVLNVITFPLSETVTAHAPCHVTSNRGQK